MSISVLWISRSEKTTNKTDIFQDYCPCLLSSWPWMYFPFSFPGQSAEGKCFQMTFLRLFCTYTRCHKRKLVIPADAAKNFKAVFHMLRTLLKSSDEKWPRYNMYALQCCHELTALQHISQCFVVFCVYFSSVDVFFTLLAVFFPITCLSSTSLSLQFTLQLSVDFIIDPKACMQIYVHKPSKNNNTNKSSSRRKMMHKSILGFPNIS